MPLGEQKKLVILIGGCALLALGALVWPPLAQDPEYHDFADQRMFLGLPHALNVLSNLPFLFVGGLGLWVVARSTSISANTKLINSILFLGIGLTGFGSAYYHWAPTTASLFWDRLPMSIGFTAFFSCLIADRCSERLGHRLAAQLICFGAGSVMFWRLTEEAGHGDLRPYALVQFGGLVLSAMILGLYQSGRLSTTKIVRALLLYGLAKILERADAEIFSILGFISGHSLKHLAAAYASYEIFLAIKDSLSFEKP